MFPSRLQKTGGWGSTSQKNFTGTFNKNNEMDDNDEIAFPSRAQKPSGGNTSYRRPVTSLRQDDPAAFTDDTIDDEYLKVF